MKIAPHARFGKETVTDEELCEAGIAGEQVRQKHPDVVYDVVTCVWRRTQAPLTPSTPQGIQGASS